MKLVGLGIKDINTICSNKSCYMRHINNNRLFSDQDGGCMVTKLICNLIDGIGGQGV